MGQGKRFEFIGGKDGYWDQRAAVAAGHGQWTDCPDMFADNDGAGVYK